MDYLGAEISKKIKSAIRAKLVELGVYVDDELPDYIMVLVANKKTRSQMERDLALFLSDHTAAFVVWLQQVLDKLQTITLAKDKGEDEKSGSKSISTKEREKKRKSSEVGSESAKKVRSDDTKEKERRRSCGEPHKSKKDKDAKHFDKDAKHVDKDAKYSDKLDAKHSDVPTSKKKEERTKSRESRDAEEPRTKSRDREHRAPEERTRERGRTAPVTKPSAPAATRAGTRRSSRSIERDSGSEGRRPRRRSSQQVTLTSSVDGRKHPRVSAPKEPAAKEPAASPPMEEEEDQDVLNLSAEEDELVKEAPPVAAPRPPAPAPAPAPAAATPHQQPAAAAVTVRSLAAAAPVTVRTVSSGTSGTGGISRVVNVREESGMFSRRVVTEEAPAARRRSSRSRSPTRRRDVKVTETESRWSRRGPQSTVGAVVSREVDDTEYDPLNPAVGAVASTVKITERPRRPAGEQPRPTLLLKAMRDAQRSTVASVRPFLVRAQNEPQQTQQQRYKRETRELYTASLASRQRRLAASSAGTAAAADDGAPRAVQARSQRSGSPGQIAITVRNSAAETPAEPTGSSPGRRRRRSRQNGSPPAPRPDTPPEEPLKEVLVEEEETMRSPEPPSSDEDTVHVTIGKVKAHPHHTEPVVSEMPEYRPTPTLLTSVDDISAIVHAVADRIKNPPRQRSTAVAESHSPARASTSSTHNVAVSAGSSRDLSVLPPAVNWKALLPPLTSWPTSQSPGSSASQSLPPADPNNELVVLATSSPREPPSSPTFVVTMTGLGVSRFARSIDSDAALGAEDEAPPNGHVYEEEEEEEEEEELEEEDLRQQLLEDRARKSAHPVIAAPTHEQQLETAAPPKPAGRCRFWPNCKLGTECTFLHPTAPCKTFPACKFGDACLYVHPPCKFDGSCTRPDCRFSHSAPRPAAVGAAAAAPVTPFGGVVGGRPVTRPGSIAAECKFFPNCTNPACPFIHPKMCRYAEACSNPSCLFAHPMPALGSGRPQFKWVAPGAI